jgi:hypothetical protein
MSVRRSRHGGLTSAAAVLTALVVPSCEPIEPRPLVDPPTNVCPCDLYEPGTNTAARCTTSSASTGAPTRRCEILTAGGRPDYPFWIVVHVPDSSFFAPGSTFVLYSDEQGNPAFKEPDPGTTRLCRPPLCLSLGGLVDVRGAYLVKSEVSNDLGYRLNDGVSIPVRVAYEPLGNEQAESFPRLPLDRLFTSSRLVQGASRSFRAAPAGKYLRVFYPEPPFDEFFPPRADELETTGDIHFDEIIFGFSVNDIKVDDLGGATRRAKVTREAGLDGWRVWLAERKSQRRISVIRRLSGTEATVDLYTSIDKGLDEVDTEAIVAPPESWTAVPRYATLLIGGAGLQSLNYPAIPPPVPVEGVVAEPTKSPTDPLFGYAARVTFESESRRGESLATEKEPLSLLRYSTTVSTDERGRFATVLPPGTYIATIEPAEGTRYATYREIFTVDRTLTTRTFQPPLQTKVRGRAVLTDGRPLSDAEVIAIPNTSPDLQPAPGESILLTKLPHPARTRTGRDGTFALEMDPGPYFLSVIPKAGTGFPRVVVRPEIPSGEAELPEIRVPAPIRLAFTLRDPSPFEIPITNAVVRVFAKPRIPGGGQSEVPRAFDEPVEIGRSMTDSSGNVEILLAQEPR